VAGFYHRNQQLSLPLGLIALTRVITLGLARPVDNGPGLSRGLYLDQLRKMAPLEPCPYRIAIEGDHVIGERPRISQRPLPQTFAIDRLLPDTVIAFMDHTPERDPSLLDGTHMLAQIHQDRRIRGQRL
jgi:hypothetical protein